MSFARSFARFFLRSSLDRAGRGFARLGFATTFTGFARLGTFLARTFSGFFLTFFAGARFLAARAFGDGFLLRTLPGLLGRDFFILRDFAFAAARFLVPFGLADRFFADDLPALAFDLLAAVLRDMRLCVRDFFEHCLFADFLRFIYCSSLLRQRNVDTATDDLSGFQHLC